MSDMQIEKLVNKVESNEVVLPEFQREYVWDKDQAKELMKSLYKEYPIGSLLIWETETPPEIKNDAVNREQYGLFKVLLDGQQRLTTLYLLIQDEIPPFYEEEEINVDPRNLYFNVDSGDFHYENKNIRESPEWVKVVDLFNERVSAFDIANQVEDDDKSSKAEHYHQQINRLQNITTQHMPVQDLPKTADVHQAIDLFDRVNSQGTDLGKAELALAHMSAHWPYVRRNMKEKQFELKERGYDFDLDFYVKCMIAVVTGGMTYQNIYDTDEETLKKKWKQIEDILDFVVNFLENEAHMPDSSYLSTRAVLIPLVAYLDRKDIRLNRAEKNSFLYWMYAALMRSRYSRATDSKLEKDLSLLGGEDPTSELVDEILDEAGRIEVDTSDLEGRGKRSKRFYNMVRIVTRANNPVDWKTGEPLKGSNYELHSHHIFPRSQLYGNLYDSKNHMGKKRVNEIANRAFLTSRGNLDVFDDLPEKDLKEAKENHPDALKKQFIPENEELWKLQNYEAFLAKRREMLATAINDFLDSLKVEVEEGMESLEDLIEKGENARIEFKETFLYDVHQDQANKDLKKTAVKEICAFANSEGGNLIIGVDDDGKVTGLERDLKLIDDKDSFEVQLDNEISARISKSFASIYTRVKFEEIDGKEVCIVSVEPTPEPVYFEEDDFYIRSGSNSRTLTISEAHEYIEEHWS